MTAHEISNTMAAVAMHHFSGPSAPFVRSKGTVSGGVFKDSVLGRFGRQTAHTAAWILRHGLAHVVSSDAHSLHSRAISLDILFQQIAKDYSQQYAELLLHDNPTRILRNQHMIQPEAKLESTDP